MVHAKIVFVIGATTVLVCGCTIQKMMYQKMKDQVIGEIFSPRKETFNKHDAILSN